VTPPALTPPRAHVGETFGAQLRRLRLARRLTQDELAERIGTGRNRVSGWENDVDAPATHALLERVACALESPIVIATAHGITTITPLPR